MLPAIPVTWQKKIENLERQIFKDGLADADVGN
jgi:hypothetical protein